MTANKRLSFEFFPPKTAAGRERLVQTRTALARLKPDFFSVTYGAGGSTREHTRSIALDTNAAGLPAAPHLSFGGDDTQTVLELLETYRDAGIRRIVALRGDTPSGAGITRLIHASELVAFIRHHTGDHFHLDVAAYPEIHPEAPGYDRDVQFLKTKLDAGADSAITQYFYNADAYFWFLDKCAAAGIEKPIYPGIMPITNYASLAGFSDRCGAEIPRWMRRQLENFGEDRDSITGFGLEIVSRLCDNLLAGGAPGLHFYTMNQADPSATLCRNIGLTTATADT